MGKKGIVVLGLSSWSERERGASFSCPFEFSLGNFVEQLVAVVVGEGNKGGFVLGF